MQLQPGRTQADIGGIGGGGAIPTAKSVAQVANTSRTGVGWVQMGALTLTLNLQADSKLLVQFSAAYSNTSGGAATLFRMVIDGGVVLNKGQTSWGTTAPEGVDMTFLSVPLAAGNHTVTIEWNANSAATIACNPTTDPNNHSAILVAQELFKPVGGWP